MKRINYEHIPKSRFHSRARGHPSGCRGTKDKFRESLSDSHRRGALDFSAQHFTDEDIFNAKYCHELPKVRRPETVLCLDRFMEGIGNGSCGPTTLPKYKITPGQEYSCKFRIEANADGFR